MRGNVRPCSEVDNFARSAATALRGLEGHASGSTSSTVVCPERHDVAAQVGPAIYNSPRHRMSIHMSKDDAMSQH